MNHASFFVRLIAQVQSLKVGFFQTAQHAAIRALTLKTNFTASTDDVKSSRVKIQRATFFESIRTFVRKI